MQQFHATSRINVHSTVPQRLTPPVMAPLEYLILMPQSRYYVVPIRSDIDSKTALEGPELGPVTKARGNHPSVHEITLHQPRHPNSGLSYA